MDPLEEVVVGHDTTFCLMLECQRRGHEVVEFGQRDLAFRNGRVSARMRTVRLRRQTSDFFDVVAEGERDLASLDVIFLRKDPPVDVEFLHATQLVELATGSRGRPLLVNHPSGLRDANEKLFALYFPDLIPRTLVSRDLRHLRGFLDELGGEMVVKPVDGFAGRGVVHLRRNDWNLGSILEMATKHGAEAVVAQEYLPASREGDKRIILLDGEAIGVLLRVPADDDLRGNLAVGGRFEKTTLTDRDREICRCVAPELRRRGLVLVGLDVIGGALTEINVTSPTGIEEINRVENASIERDVIDFVETRLQA